MKYADDQEEVCSGHGTCDVTNGKCVCFPSFSGTKCHEKLCPGQCSGRGHCNKATGECECNGGYEGHSCQHMTCAGGCGGTSRGACDRDSGHCVCHEGYSGTNCGKSTSCDVQATTFQEWAMFRVGWSKCPTGSVVTGLKTASQLNVDSVLSDCSSIECLERARCAKPCFEGTPLQLGHCYQANWWKSFNHAGWSKCREPYFLAGLYRSACSSLYCIEVAHCCEVHAATYSQCGEHSWVNQITKADSWAEVPTDRFVTGLYRAGNDATIHDMTKAAFCNFALEGRSTADSTPP